MFLRQQFRSPIRNIASVLLLTILVAALCIGVGQQQAALSAEKSVSELYTTVTMPVPNVQTLWISGGMTKFQYTSKLLTQEQQDVIDQLLNENSTLVKTVSNTGLASAYIPQLQPDMYTDHDYRYSYVKSDALHPADDGAPYCCAMLEVELQAVSERVKHKADARENGLLTTGKTARWSEELKTYYSVVVTGKIKSVVGLQPDLPDPTGYTAKLILMIPNEEALQELQLQIGQRYLVYGMDYYDLDWHNSADSVWNQLNVRSVTFTMKDYSALTDCGEQYAVPTIAHLEGSVEEFLQSEEGALWAQKLEHMQVNYQAFPIIGVEKLGYIADFARETARIVEGRDFTAEELASGAKVCIISESLAAANGLTVGDTISPRFYNYDYNDPYQGFLTDGKGLVNPSAYAFTSHTEWAGEPEEYIIVGLYRQDNAWCDVSDNLYSFTPNTIFAPITSISSDMDYGSQGLFQTLVLHNGAIEEFRALVEEAGYPDLFVFYDQEYTTISDSLENYREVAQRAMLVGVAVYAVILLLFLLFYPGSQGKALATMTALGAQRKHKFTHVFTSGAGILIPGTVIGFALGALLWQEIVDMIAGTVDAAVTLEMDMGVFLQIALFQLLVALALTALIALPMTLIKGLSKRK